jgi:hypothetical protein
MILENLSATLLGALMAFSGSVGITADSIKAAVPKAQAQVTQQSDIQFNWNNWGDWRSSKPVINDINPEHGEAGTTVALTGKHFDDDDVVRFGKSAVTDVDVSTNGKTLTFVVPDKDAGEYNIRVQDGWKFSNAVQFEITDDADTDEPLVIDAVAGPTALDEGEEGTWKVDVLSEGEGNLQYSVKWGDENWAPLRLLSLDEKTQSSAIFTHTYADAGTYHPEFKVVDEEGNEATSSITVIVGDDEDNNIPHITLLSPTSVKVGSTVTVTGTNFDEDSTVKIGNATGTNVDVQSDTKLTFTVPNVAIGTHAVSVTDNDGTSNTLNLKVIVLSKVSITGVDAPSRLEVGEEGTWTVNVASNAAGNLKYSVDWGETGIMARLMSNDEMTQSSATFTHAYESEGTYYPKFTVTDENGIKSSVSASVIVK